MSSDSEEALWSHLSNSQEHAWQAAIEQDVPETIATDVPSQADFFSAPSYRKKANTPKKVVKKSIVAGSRTSTSHPDKWSGKSSRVGPSIGQQLASMSSVSVQSNVTVDSDGYATAFGSDFEVLEVNSMNGTDNKSFSAATRRSTLSRSSSENTSTASLSSTSSSAESPHFGQKRTLEYTESFVWTSSPSSPSHKVRKVTKQVHNSSANPSTVDAQPPQTPRKPKFRPAVNFADACGSINPMVSASKHTAPPSTTSLQPSPSIGDPLPSSLASSATAYSHTTTQDSATKHEPSGSRQFLKNSLFSAARGLATSVLGTSSQDISTPIIPHKDSETFESVQTAAEQVSIIAHSSDVQRLMDLKRIAWGVQYELARGVCHGRWTWENVTSAKLDLLVGSNKAAAHLVAQVMLSSNNANKVAITELPLWTELDREEEAIIENRSRGLGLQGEWFEDSNWYGGKITQIARLTKNEKGSAAPFRVLLERMEKRKSNRFARFLGSRRLLQVSISKDLMYAEQTQLVRDFICRKFILCGRVYVPFCAKDKKVFMMEINEDYERAANLNGDQYRMSLESFVNWHNPLTLNGNQPTTKWSTRFQLGLSNSVPVLEFQGVGLDMFYIEDEVAPYAPSLKKAPTENIFTDGCGFMNGAALTLIGRRLGYSERPTAVQGRIGGAKGLWALHPEDRDPNTTPKVWTRSSQRKIKYNDATLGLAQRIFDLVAPPRITKPSRLSKHTIMNLSHNGVPSHIFISLMRECLQKEIEALTRWNTQHDMLLLWNAINQGFHVSTKKIYRQVTASLRALGVGGREIDRDDDEDNDGDDSGEDTLSGFTGRDEYSGQPDKAADTVLEMLQAGFHPLKLPILYDKLHTIIKMKIDDIIKDYKIVVPYSAEVFIIPDPFGVLEEGQIHFKSSQDLKDPLEDASPRNITGEVLIYRNPARLPSDVQKVTAISHPDLSEYINVIVLPVKGSRSLANLLAGGDVDGDVCCIIFDQTIVSHFTNSAYSTEPENFKENFEPEGDIPLVATLDNTMQLLSATEARVQLQTALVTGLSDAAVGLYSTFHENAAYAYGYGDKRTIRNAYMFTTVLDSGKTGLKVRADIFRSDKKQFGHDPPPCMNPKEVQPSSKSFLRRRISAPFILDQLLKAGKAMEEEHLKKYDDLRTKLVYLPDTDLLKPSIDADAFAALAKEHGFDRFIEELLLIQVHVEKHVQSWRDISTQLLSKQYPASQSLKGKGKSRTAQAYQDLSKSYAQGPKGVVLLTTLSGTGVEEIKASYAYRKSSRFAFSVAFGSLCSIKARAIGSIAITQPFVDIMSIPASAARILAHSRIE